MSGNLLLVNPRRRSKKRRSPAQKAATRKLVARNRRRGGKRSPVAKRKRRRNPSPPGTTYKRKPRARRSNPRRRRSVGRVFTQRKMMDYATAATIGASGAIALDVVLSYLPLPVMLKVGIPGKITKGVAAIAMGAVADMSGLVKASTARDMTVGALTVQFVGIGRDLLAQFAPGIALSAYMNEDYEAVAGLGYAGSGWDPSQALSWGNNGMSAYNVGEGYDIAAPGYAQPGLEAYESSNFDW